MPYSVTTYDDGHILLLTLNSEFDPAVHMVPAFTECFETLEAGPDNVVFISDARNYTIGSFNDLLQGANMARSAEVARANKHPKVRKVFTITNSGTIQLTAKGLNSASFGFIELTVFSSLEDALNQARTVLFGQSKAN
jgi:hypothetical protein